MPDGMFHEDESKRRYDRTEGTNHISVNCEESSPRDFFDTRVDLRVGEYWGVPDWVDPNPHYPKSMHHYNIPTTYDPTEGEVERTFWVLIRHAGTEELLCGPMGFKFKTDEYGIHHAYVSWGIEPDPEPEPDPDPPPEPEPDPDPTTPTPYLDALNQMAMAQSRIADALVEIANSKLFRL